MANTLTLNITAQFTAPGGAVPLNISYTASQSGTAFVRRTFNVQSETDGWSQWTKPTEMGDVEILVVLNPSTNSNNVNYALSGAATYQPSEIPPGAGIVLFNPAATEIYFSHLGGTGTTQDIEILAAEA